MQTPVCSICLKSGFLCQGCESKIKDGKISELDVKVARALFELSKKHKGLDQLVFKRSIDSEGLVILIVGEGQIPLLVGKRGRLIQEVEHLLDTRIRVIEQGASTRKIAEDIVAPAEVLGVNVLYAKTGEQYRLRVARHQAKLLPGSRENVQQALNVLTDKNFAIVFE